MRKFKYFFTILSLMILSTGGNAQAGNNESTVGEFMRSTQRSYVVIAVMLTILAGIVLYLVRLGRKINKFEKENRQ